MIGQTIGHYRVLEHLGSGGMGEVYLAEDVRLHRSVALKMLRDDVRADEDARARLLREARAAAALSHPGIAVVYEIDELDRGEGPPLRFIAMEYVAGETLGEHARRDPPSLDRALDIVERLAEALGEAHCRGIVHRDVKPSNVMVGPDGRLKILDFGLAKQHVFGDPDGTTWSRDAARSGAGALLGTLAYMAPEQARGKAVDARADVYSLGALLYELVAGTPAFAGENAVQVLDAVLHQTPAPLPARHDPRLTQVESLVRRMLSKEPALRPTSMDEVREAVSAMRQGAPALPTTDLGPAVAVLGFANISGHGEDDWLGTGIAETVMSDLRSLPGLAVVAPARVREALRNAGAESGEIDESAAQRAGRELGARWVLSGGVQRAGTAVRVTARLADVEGQRVLRTVKLDGPLDGIFALQDRIVRELASGLRMGVPRSADGEETHVVEAYEAYSRGLINLQLESYESLDRAILYFERAVSLDPTYVRALVELGHAYANKADYLTLPELSERALSSYRRALERHPGSARAWRLMGSTLVSLGRDEEGFEALHRALELAPEDAGAQASMGRALFVARGRFREAASCFERALARDPQAGWFALQLAHCLALLGDFARGEEVARRAAGLQESLLSGREGFVIVGSYMRLGHLAALQGRDAEAVENFQRELAFLQRVDHALRRRITIELHLRLGGAHRRLGQAEASRAALETAREAFEERVGLGADDPFTRYYAAAIYAQLGNTEEALSCLERAAAGRPALTAARAPGDPELEALRGESRFQALVREAP